MWKKVWIEKGDYVLVNLRNFEDQKADIVHKYTVIEAQKVMEMESKSQANDDSGANASNSIMNNDFEWVCFDNVCTLVRSDGATNESKVSVEGPDDE